MKNLQKDRPLLPVCDLSTLILDVALEHLSSGTHVITMYLADPSQVRYAILSHVWRESEQSFQDIQQLRTQYGSEGNPRDHTLVKIRRCCVYAEEHGSKWVWVDTCCIDKSSSAELSEAINSMYIWYTRAAVCYVFLDDVGDDEDPRGEPTSVYGSYLIHTGDWSPLFINFAGPDSSCYARPIPTDTAFSRSKWFTRGWTLQELIAPASLMFLSRDWRTLGTKYDLADLLEAITGIDAPVLRHETQLASISIARRMSWAARRQTTRAEDCAYSLMGLFGIHMPTIYGEGTKAFIRLQQEIIRHSPDHSIFAWGPIHQSFPSASTNALGFTHHRDPPERRALLASSPDAFAQSADIETWDLHSFMRKLNCEVPDFHLSGYGMRTTLPMVCLASATRSYVYAVILACKDARGFPVMLFLQPSDVVNMSTFTVGEYIKDDIAPAYCYYRAAYLPLAKDTTTARVLRSLHPTQLYIELQTGALRQELPLPSPSSRRPVAVQLSWRLDHTVSGVSLSGYTFFFPPWVIARLSKRGFTPDRRCDNGMVMELAPCHAALFPPSSPGSGRAPHNPKFSIVTFTSSRIKARFSVIFGYRCNTSCGRSLSDVARGYCPSVLVTSAGMPHRESSNSSECLYTQRFSSFTVLAGRIVQVEIKKPWEGFRPPRGRLRDSPVHFIDLRMS